MPGYLHWATKYLSEIVFTVALPHELELQKQVSYFASFPHPHYTDQNKRTSKKMKKLNLIILGCFELRQVMFSREKPTEHFCGSDCIHGVCIYQFILNPTCGSSDTIK